MNTGEVLYFNICLRRSRERTIPKDMTQWVKIKETNLQGLEEPEILEVQWNGSPGLEMYVQLIVEKWATFSELNTLICSRA